MVGRRGYPPEFRRKVLDLVEVGRPVADVARDLGISSQTVNVWRRQDLVDRGLAGIFTAEALELAAAKCRIPELEAELPDLMARPTRGDKPADDVAGVGETGVMPATPTPSSAALPAVQQVVLDVARTRDLALLALADLYVSAEAADGPSLDALLAIDAGLTADTRRGLRTVATVLPHLPTLRAAIDGGRIGFDTIVGCCRAARTNRLNLAQLALLDDVIAALLADGQRWDPDDLVEHVRDHAIAIRPDDTDDRVRDTDEVRFWPGLFGDGTIVADLTPASFQHACATIDATMQRHRLLDRTALQPCDDDASAAANDVTIATARGAAFTALLTDRGSAGRPVPSVQVTVDLDTLAGHDDLPARLLGGGRLTAGTLRRFVDTDGADVTAIVIDHDRDDTVVGIGRRHRVPPGWLRDLVHALQPRCVIPGCRRRVTDLDHADRWTHGGPTDLANLSRLCRTHHREKDHDDLWQVAPSSSGAVTVTHAPTGWTSTTRPTTTGPPPVARARARGTRRSPQPRLPIALPRSERAPPKPVAELPY